MPQQSWDTICSTNGKLACHAGHDLNWPQLISFLSPWIIPLCVSCNAICCWLTPPLSHCRGTLFLMVNMRKQCPPFNWGEHHPWFHHDGVGNFWALFAKQQKQANQCDKLASCCLHNYCCSAASHNDAVPIVAAVIVTFITLGFWNIHSLAWNQMQGTFQIKFGIRLDCLFSSIWSNGRLQQLLVRRGQAKPRAALE